MITVHTSQGASLVKFPIENGKLFLISVDIDRNEILSKFHIPLECQDIDIMRFITGSGSMLTLFTATDVHIIRVASSEFENSIRIVMQCSKLEDDHKDLEMWVPEA
jgi:hypothetical protein